jgi:TPR repeat protein
LGKAYECGTGIRKNSRLALKWFRAAANQGNEMAAEKLKEIAG